jgi:hypothetical protein
MNESMSFRSWGSWVGPVVLLSTEMLRNNAKQTSERGRPFLHFPIVGQRFSTTNEIDRETLGSEKKRAFQMTVETSLESPKGL